MKYYKKLYPKVRLFASNGQVVPFENLSTNIGLIKLDEEKDKIFIDYLEGLIKNGMGGVVAINRKSFEKKKKNLLQQRQQSTDQLKSLRLFNPNNPLEMEKSYAQNAKGQGIAQSAVIDGKPALIAEEQDTINPIKVLTKGSKVKVGKPKPVLEENAPGAG